MIKRLTLIGAPLLALVSVRCSADLADGDPCLAIVQSYCNWQARCNVLSELQTGDNEGSPPTASSCVTSTLNSSGVTGVTGNSNSDACNASASSARSCASAIDALDCVPSPGGDAASAAFEEGPAECMMIGILGDGGGGFSFPVSISDAGGGGAESGGKGAKSADGGSDGAGDE